MAGFNPLTRSVSFVVIGRAARNGTAGVAPRATPGVATVSDADTENVLDAQQGAGTTGAPIRYRGRELIKFNITLHLWLPAHWDAWEIMRPLFQTPPFGTLPAPLSVSHPWLAQAGVSQATVKKLSQPVLDDHMLGTIKILLWEYKKPRITLATLKPEADKPLSKIDQELKAARETLEKQNAALASKKT